MKPVTVLTADAIAKVAFEEFAKAGSVELAKKSVGGASTSSIVIPHCMSI